MYISLCAIRSWNWNWKLTQDNFLIERWIQPTHRCSAVRCWPWRVFSSWLASRDLGTTRSSYLAWVGPVLMIQSSHRLGMAKHGGDWCSAINCTNEHHNSSLSFRFPKDPAMWFCFILKWLVKLRRMEKLLTFFQMIWVIKAISYIWMKLFSVFNRLIKNK